MARRTRRAPLSMLAAISIALVIAVGCLVPLPAFGAGESGIHFPLPLDKVAHFLAFGVLAVAIRRALLDRKWVRSGLPAASLSTGYGWLLELLQAPLTYRAMEWRDGMADAAGAFLLVGCYWLLRREP